jgi:hypothetical protein
MSTETLTFAACRYESHAKCSKRFEYKGDTYVCNCDCHNEQMKQAISRAEDSLNGLKFDSAA